MAYATSSPPTKLVGGMMGGGATTGRSPTLWGYTSVDVDSDVNAAGYITDAVDLGMKLGDVVFVHDTATPKASVHYVTTISGTTMTLAFAAVA